MTDESASPDQPDAPDQPRPLDEPERLFARKYADSDAMHHDGRHAWLRPVPDKVTSWDFRLLFPAKQTPTQQTTTS